MFLPFLPFLFCYTFAMKMNGGGKVLEDIKSYLFAAMEFANGIGWKKLLVMLVLGYLVTEINVLFPRLLMWPVIMLIVLKLLVVSVVFLQELFRKEV